MNRLTPWFETPAAPVPSTPDRDALLAATRILRLDTAVEPEPVLLDRTSTGRPLSVVLPTPYEPKYAYPLIVWLHGDGADETEATSILPAISDQNFVGAGLRAPVGGWDATDVADWSTELYDALVDLRRAYHVHSERIFLAGHDAGATMAVTALLHHPEWFAGALALGGDIALPPGSLARFQDLRGKRLLLATGPTPNVPTNGLVSAVRHSALAGQLRSAGMEVTLHTHDGDADLLREANRWLVDSACAVV